MHGIHTLRICNVEKSSVMRGCSRLTCGQSAIHTHEYGSFYWSLSQGLAPAPREPTVMQKRNIECGSIGGCPVGTQPLRGVVESLLHEYWLQPRQPVPRGGARRKTPCVGVQLEVTVAACDDGASMQPASQPRRVRLSGVTRELVGEISAPGFEPLDCLWVIELRLVAGGAGDIQS